MTSHRVILATFGTLGDLYPYLAIARELNARGHRAAVATAEFHRATVEGADVELLPIRPDLPRDNFSEAFAGVMDARGGTKYLFQNLILPALRQSYDDLTRATANADLLVTHSLAPGAVLVAQKQNVPWISAVVSPIFFYSQNDPPLLPILPQLARAPLFGTLWTRFLMRVVHRRFEPTFAPLYEFRRELGLPRGALPLFEGQHSPHKVLALFSRVLAEPQPDWPQNTIVTGFCELDDRRDLSPTARGFLERGNAPLVFTLGASSTHAPGDFWAQSVASARLLKRRALLLTGRDDVTFAPSPDVAVFAYEPLGQILPRAAALVHHGGMGTIALALRAACPQLIMPLANDQPDNAARIARHRVARVLSPAAYQAPRVALEIRKLLEDQLIAQRGAELQKIIEAENGAKTAAEQIEKYLNSRKGAKTQRVF